MYKIVSWCYSVHRLFLALEIEGRDFDPKYAGGSMKIKHLVSLIPLLWAGTLCLQGVSVGSNAYAQTSAEVIRAGEKEIPLIVMPVGLLQ
jgi:hypothetical protein